MSPGFDHVRCMILSRPGLKQPDDIIPALCVSADEPHTYMFSGSHGRDATRPSPITIPKAFAPFKRVRRETFSRRSIAGQ